MYIWEEERCCGNDRRRSRLSLPPHRSSSQMYISTRLRVRKRLGFDTMFWPNRIAEDHSRLTLLAMFGASVPQILVLAPLSMLTMGIVAKRVSPSCVMEGLNMVVPVPVLMGPLVMGTCSVLLAIDCPIAYSEAPSCSGLLVDRDRAQNGSVLNFAHS
eukprot:gene23882-biopygen9694